MSNNFHLYELLEILGTFIIRNLKFKKIKKTSLLNCIYVKGHSDQVQTKFPLFSKKMNLMRFFKIKNKSKIKKNKNLTRQLYLLTN